jgi:hypothetical protein
MKPMGWRFVVVADLGLPSKEAVRVPSGDGDAILAALRPSVEIAGARREFAAEKAFAPEALGTSPDALRRSSGSNRRSAASSS